jgi:hypothetical protein
MPDSPLGRTPWRAALENQVCAIGPHASQSRGSNTIRSTLGTGSFAVSNLLALLRCQSATKRRRSRGQVCYFVIHGPLSTSRRRLYRCMNSAAQTAPARTTRNQIICSCCAMLGAKQSDRMIARRLCHCGSGLLRSGGRSLHTPADVAIELTH